MKMKCLIVMVPLFVLATCLISTAEVTTSGFGSCGVCHTEIADNLTTSLHYTGRGMMSEYVKGAAREFEINMSELYADKGCANCHVVGCSDCHGPEPHVEDLSGKIETCDKCHLKKQATFIGDMPAHKSRGPSADIHYEKGLVCVDCHTASEIHGDGIEYVNMLSAVKVTCEDCHENPGKRVNGMLVTQYSDNIESHEIHEGTLDCSACHIAWMPTCVNCHLETMKIEGIVTDKFHLAKAADGEIKPFLEMVAMYDNKTHIAYAEYFAHTITDEPHDCEFCHENDEVFCAGFEGQMLGPEGASFLSSETIEEKYRAGTMPTPDSTPTPTPTDTPGFGAISVFAGLLAVLYLLRRQV